MSDGHDFDEDASQRTSTAPYNARHPVPTIRNYQNIKDARQAEAEANVSDLRPSTEEKNKNAAGPSNARKLLDSTKGLLHIDPSTKDESVNDQEPYNSRNRNVELPNEDPSKTNGWGDDKLQKNDNSHHMRKDAEAEGSQGDGLKDTSEAVNSSSDPRQKRKTMKRMKRDNATRTVTDPVTHLPVTVHDSTSKELTTVPENEPPADSEPSSSTLLNGESKGQTHSNRDMMQQQEENKAIERLFPPPALEVTRDEVAKVYSTALVIGSVAILATTIFTSLITFGINKGTKQSWLSLAISTTALLTVSLSVGGTTIWVIQGWLRKKVQGIWDDEVWDAARRCEQETTTSSMPESTQWLNALLASVWPLINPDLFTSLADELEDVMQASLPKMVRMISVEDIAQGSEAIRILGIRWLPTGAAARKVSKTGQIEDTNGTDSDYKEPGEGKVDEDDDRGGEGEESEKVMTENQEKKGASEDEMNKTQEDENVDEGMEAEEGDFVNIEVAFSYRASRSGKSLAVKSKNAHLYLAFYLPGGLKFPVWVELRGMVGTMRLRLQLCPDPPFFALCTLTLLGQPKADMSCVPLTRRGLNIMDLPLISSFVQSSIDAALAEYVAPKSLTLDLKDMLVGDDFKKDTIAKGVLVVKIKRGRDFKCGDPGVTGLKKGSSDAYVAVGWAKFGKPVWSTRVIVDDMEPIWNETAFILVGPAELNAHERLRIQLWDSDRISADDDLGRIEVDLNEMMLSKSSKGVMCDRTDSFQALEGSDSMPGTLDWSVGYFPKTRIQDEELKEQTVEDDVRTKEDLKNKVSDDAERKLREATKDQSHELEQQKAQDLKRRQNAMIISTPPLHNYPTGIFSIQVHQITGLEFEKINKHQHESNRDEGDDTAEGVGELPSSYATVILNHEMIFKTRTKPKNANPFFNAGTERMVRDWHTAEVIVSVRDSRVHENDPLLGIVYLQLGRIFKERSQIMETFPLVGGIGYGRARISMIFRSIELQLPKELRGWDYGTVELISPVTSKDISPGLTGLRIKFRSSVNRGKMYSATSEEELTKWAGKHSRPIRLAVRKRYCSCIIIEFRKNTIGKDKTPAFASLWLKDIPDEEDLIKSLTVWKAEGDWLKRAQANCLEDCGKKMGTIDVSLKFYRGLGAYHHRLASKSPNLQDVFEVLATADENQEIRMGLGGEDDTEPSSYEDSSESDGDEDNGDGKASHPKVNRILGKVGLTNDHNSVETKNDGSGNPIQQIKAYSTKSGQLHRKHRGLMQWKGARTADWMKTKMEHGKDHVMDNFKHHERDPGVETEV